MKILACNIVTAFSARTIGTKVTSTPSQFMQVVMDATEAHDVSSDREPGQHFVMLPEGAKEMVSCGVGRHTGHEDDYIVRMHRDEPGLFLTRVNAAECTGVAAIVYTLDAFKADPQVDAVEAAELESFGATHVLVAVLGFSDAPPALSSHRFTRNAAGGNKAFLTMSADELRADAAKVVEYEQTWCTVAD